VNRDFWLGHPEQIGVSVGVDGSGEQAETPVLLMPQSVIGGARSVGTRQSQ
jgi:hypothetical protein